MGAWRFGSWIRSNAIPLAVIVVAGAGLVGVLLGLPLYSNAQFQPPTVELAKGESHEAAGYTWTVVASGEFLHAENADVPEGLAITAAIIEVRPTDDPETSAGCDAELTSGNGPDAPRWMTLSNPYDFNYAVADESTTACLLSGEPFDLEVVYLAPEGTLFDAVVEVDIDRSSGEELMRFALTD